MQRVKPMLACLIVAPIILSFAGPAQPQAKDKADPLVGQRVAAFVLPDSTGKQVGAADFKDPKAIVVVFMGTKCPVGNAYLPILLDLHKLYHDKGIHFVGINANPGDSADAIAKHVKEYAIPFPVLVDGKQSALTLFEASRTPEVFLLDGRNVVRYHGRIDDRYGLDYKRDEPRRHDLREALDEVLSGKKVSVSTTEIAGCKITPAGALKKGDVTYARHVAPILQKNCVDCHRPGTAAPFSLLTYDDAVNWSAMMREVVSQRRMPPWHADPRFGHFANTRSLSPEEIHTIRAWVDHGTPRGDKKDEPTPPKFDDGWRIGKPDVVFKMPTEFKVPAKGTVKYQYFTTKTDFKEDMYIQAAETRPGNRAVVHHIIVFYRDPTSLLMQRVWVVSTAPGAEPVVFPKGLGRKIPAGAELIWQMHYTPSGKEETDRSEVAFVFCKEPPKSDVINFGIANMAFKIPAGEPSHKVTSSIPVFKDAVLLSLYPHMHVRGKSFQYEAVFPDGKRQMLLSIPQYDFNWQNTYRLKEPLFMPKGARLECTAHFDNSAANPANPDPTKAIRWGDQTWDEMMIGYIDFHYVEAKEKK